MCFYYENWQENRKQGLGPSIVLSAADAGRGGGPTVQCGGWEMREVLPRCASTCNNQIRMLTQLQNHIKRLTLQWQVEIFSIIIR